MKKRIQNALIAVVLSFGLIATPALATTVTVVTPTNTQGWSTADTRTGGQVNYVTDTTSPYPDGALQLTTDATTAAKAQYLHAANVPLTNVTNLSYYTNQISGPSYADPSYQLLVYLNGTTGSFTSLVYEPYQNGTITTGWQHWDVAGGKFWSTRSFTDGTCSVTAGTGGAPFYTLAGLKATCPHAVVIGFGVNIGTNNPSYNVYTDGVAFNGTIYNFQLHNEPIDKEDCKKGGYKSFEDGNGNTFKNQGQCVSYTNHHSDGEIENND